VDIRAGCELVLDSLVLFFTCVYLLTRSLGLDYDFLELKLESLGSQPTLFLSLSLSLLDFLSLLFSFLADFWTIDLV
jgi:hypothetical protein